jgi:hypothetical protein
MTKIMGPKGMRQLSVQTKDGERVLNAGRDGMFNVSDPKLIKKLKAEGLGEASVSGVTTAAGYPCKACGFGSFFKKCSRCGEING